MAKFVVIFINLVHKKSIKNNHQPNKGIKMTIEKEFDVNICRTSFSFANVKVKTNSLDEARERALNEAGDHSYSEKDADYTIEGITPMATTAPSMVKTIEAAIEAAIGSPPNIVAKKTQDTNQVELKGVSAARSKNKPK